MPTVDEMLSIIREAKRKMDALGPPPPEIRLTRAATAMPSAEPHTDDMREYVDRVGRVRVPAAFHLTLDGREYIVVHPDAMKKA